MKNIAAIELREVTRRFETVTAVDRLSLDIEAGQTVALLGPNGAGKTTTVEMLLGLIRPDAGEVTVLGGRPEAAIAAGRVGAMLQDGGLPDGSRVGELIGLMGSLYGDPLPPEEVLRLTDLTEVVGRPVQRLSGGQRQRVRLAMALAGNPELLVLDEPTASLDVEGRRAFWDRARSFVSEGRTVLFATHRLEEADVVADRVVLISAGRLVIDGSPDEVKAQGTGGATVRFSSEALPRLVLESLPGVDAVEMDRKRVTLYTADPDRTVRALLEYNAHIDDLEITRPGMEEAFLALTREGHS